MLNIVYHIIKYNHHCDYTSCVRLSDKVSHTRYNHKDNCDKKSREASAKISGSEVTFVHNCVGSSSGKNQYRLRENK